MTGVPAGEGEAPEEAVRRWRVVGSGVKACEALLFFCREEPGVLERKGVR